MRSFYCVVLLITLSSAEGQACSCEYAGPFLTMAPNTRLTALVKVTKFLTFKSIYDVKTPMSMEVEVIEVIRGAESRKTITVWGDVGNLCRPYLSTFKVGQSYVIAFDPGQPNHGHSNEKATDYSISICGQFWLFADLEKQTVTGHIEGQVPKSQTMTVADLKAKLNKTTN